MSRLFSLKSFGLSVFAVALAFAFTPNALAAEFNGQVKVVPNPTAAPQITAKVDPAKLAALTLHELPDGAKDLGRMDGNQTLTLELRLARTHVAQSAALALRRQVQDPTSPWYGKTLTPVEFAENFGLAGSDLDTLTSWLKAQGFEVGTVDNGRMVIGFSGTVAQVDEAFHTEMHNYAAKDGSPRFAPAMAPQIPYAFHGVVGHVAGIENFREYRAATFPGPVKDFIAGTTNQKSLVETSGTSTPNPHGELLHDSSFTISSPAIGIGGHATLNVRLGGNTHPATGSLTLVNESTGDTVAHIADITACTGYNGGYGRSCTVDFAPAGAGTDFLKAVYSGDEHERGTMIGYNVISFVGTQVNYSTETISSAASTYMVYPSAPNTTFASNIYYAGGAGAAAAAPTGTYTLEFYDISSDATVLVNAANLTTCTTTTASHNVSCSNAVSGGTLSTDTLTKGYMQMDVTYSGDTNYASSTNAVFGYSGSATSSTFPTSIALNGSFTTTHTYGASATDSGVTGLTMVSAASPEAGYTKCDSVDDVLGNANLGLLGAYENAGAVGTLSYSITFTEPAITIPALLTPGTYAVSSLFAGGTATGLNASCTYGPFASASSTTLTEAKQAPTVTMTSPTAASPTTQISGNQTPFTVTGTLAWTGTGITPTPGNVTFTTTDGGSFGTVTCTAANSSTTFPTSPYTCSATFTPNVADTAGNYNLNLSFTTDTNYLAESTSVTANYIVATDSTSMTASPASIVYGGGPVTITDTIAIAHGGTAPAGSLVLTINAATTAITTITVNATNCPLTSGVTFDTYACAYSWTPPAADNVGSYTITGAYTSSNYSNSTTTTPFAITIQTPTFGAMTFSPAATEPYGTAQIITISDTLNYTGAGSAPTGAVKYVLNAVSYTATCTGSSSPLTCTYAVPAATIDVLAVNTYTVTASYTATTNYAAATGASGTFTITAATPTLALTPNPVSSAYGSVTGIVITATATGVSGGTTPGGVVTFSGAYATYGTLSSTTCTLASGACTVTFTPNGTTAVGTGYSLISASEAANGNYLASNTATDTLNITLATPTVAFNPSPITSVSGSTSPIAVTVTVSNNYTGVVNFTGTYATYGTLSATSCTITVPASGCSVTFTPSGTTAIGTYTGVLTATVPAGGSYNTATASDSLTITKNTTNVVVTPSVVNYTGTVSSSFTAVVSWVKPGISPTGTLILTDTTSSSALGGVTLPATSGTCSPAAKSGTCTYVCTTSATQLTVSCVFTDSAVYANLSTAAPYDNVITATYAGDTNFATGAGTTDVYYGASGGTAATVTTNTATLTAATYGLTQAENATVTVVSHGTSDAYPFQSGSGAFLEATSTLQNGTLYLTTDSACGNTTTTCVISGGSTGATAPLFTVPAVVTPATYTVTYTYSGDYTYSTGYDENGSVTASLTVNKQTPTLGTVVVSPTTEAYGAGTALTISDTLTYLGVGEAPQGAVTFTLNSVGYAATCTLTGVTGSGNTQSNVETCTATVTGTVIGALPVAAYTVSAAYATDTNYAACAGTSATFTITGAAPTTATISAVSAPYGSTTAVNVTVNESGSAGVVTGGIVTFSVNAPATGSFNNTTCTLNSSGNCTVQETFIPAGTLAVGVYSSIQASFGAVGNYAAATATNTETITQVTVTPAMTSVTPTNQNYGSATALSVAGTISWTGSGAAPTVGDISFTSTDAGSFTGLSCTGSSSPYSCTATFTPTGTDVIGYQAINISFSGDTNYAAAATTIPGTAGTLGTTYNWLINRQTMTFGAGSVTPNSVVFATSTAVALSQVVNFTGSGNQPGTAGFNFTLNGVTYTPSCTAAVSDSFTCTYTVAGSVIAALPVGSYPVTFNFPTAGNYNTATQSVGTLTITGAVPTTAAISAVSAPFDSTTPVNITVNESGSAGVVTGGIVTFSVNSPATGSFNHATCTLNASGNCTVQETFIPTGTLAVGVYSSIQASFGAAGNYAAATATNTETITTATETLTLASGTYVGGTNTTSSGVTSTVLTATLGVPASGATVTFTDVTTAATIGSATTNSSGVATITVNTAGTGSGQSAKPSAGIDKFSAAATATSNSGAASTTSSPTVYFQGILFSFIGNHNFSGGLTGANDPYSCCAEVEGTVDGTTAAAYGVSVVNFTSASQTLPVTLTNAASGAFSLSNQCGSTLSAGEVCTLVFDYAPPNGDGCAPVAYPGPPTGNQCTFDGANYPQGTYESATWTYTLPSGVLAGLGNQGFTTSGIAAASGTVAGKALLEPLNLSVSPTTAAFGTVAQNATSQTITIVVTNSNNSSVSYTYTVPSSGHFTATNTCSSPLAANSTCNIYLTMVTSTIGSFTDSLTLTPTGGTPATVSISGTVAASSTGITLSSNNHNFGSVTDGTSVAFSTTLTNNTGSTATISFSNAPGTGYTTSTNCGTTLAASATCTYGFTFAPTTAGAANDTLTITSSVPILPGGTGSGPYTGTVTVSGTGVAGGNLTATSVTHNWGTITVGTSGGNYGVEMTNSTSSAVTLSFSGLTGGSSGFSLVGSSCGASLAVNANCEMIFSFTPTATGFVSGSYPITSSSPLYFNGSQVSPSRITLEGTGQ